MDIEFVPEQPTPADEPEDVLSAGRPRRLPRAIGTVLLALLVAAGGIGWLHGRQDHTARPVSAPTSSSSAAAPIHEDVLAGCPDTLACDATHQMQQYQINMIKRAMAQHRQDVIHWTAHARRMQPSWAGLVTTGGTMVR